MHSSEETTRDDKTTEVTDAEREVAKAKRLLQDSLQLAGEAGTRLATEARKKLTPTLLVTVAVGVAVVASVTFVAARSAPRRRWRASNEGSPTGQLARAAGFWLLRAAALRMAVALAAKFTERAVSAPTILLQPE